MTICFLPFRYPNHHCDPKGPEGLQRLRLYSNVVLGLTAP